MLTEQSRITDFPSLAGRTYLNTAAEGIPPVCVTDALAQYAQDKVLGMDGRPLHETQWQSARSLVAEFYGLSSDEIGICSCSSEAYNLAAMALQLKDGDEVIVNDLDFPAGATPWLQPVCPAEVKVWRSNEWALRVEDLIPLLSTRTRIVTVSLVSFFNGFKVPLQELAEAVRENSDALLAVDVTQALGRVPLDLNGADLIVSSTHKWILASHGGGLVGVPSARAAELTTTAGGWFNLQDPFRENRFDGAASKPGAASFMVGMPSYSAVYAINAGLNYIKGVGVENIEQQTRPLVMKCLEGIRRFPVERITPDNPESIAGILAFRHPDAERIRDHLRSKDIHVMCQAGRMRVAIHGYNTMEDVEQLLAALAEVL
ncbi:MAG: aminotransferase class V-fold PLP-dependent enzyme [Planctomycetota bacterium]|nr:aminotransferase class V-fold PLP-dependent enzyme [Planctomycetota bacterium]